MEEKIEEEETSEETPKEEETSEETKEEVAESEGKEPDWKAKADAMYGKYKEAKETIEELEGRISELEEKTKPKKEISQDEWKGKVDFLIEHKDYSEEEFNHISTAAKEFDISLDEAALLEEDYIQYRREKVAKEKKIPAPSSPSLESKELTSEEIGKMSEEEHRRLWEEDLKSREGGEGV